MFLIRGLSQVNIFCNINGVFYFLIWLDIGIISTNSEFQLQIETLDAKLKSVLAHQLDLESELEKSKSENIILKTSNREYKRCFDEMKTSHDEQTSLLSLQLENAHQGEMKLAFLLAENGRLCIC